MDSIVKIPGIETLFESEQYAVLREAEYRLRHSIAMTSGGMARGYHGVD